MNVELSVVVAAAAALVCLSAGIPLSRDELQGFRSRFQGIPNQGLNDALNGNDEYRWEGSDFQPLNLNISAGPGHGAGIKAEQSTWCVARYGSNPTGLQAALDWACGPGFADCGLIQPGGACYLPNTLFAHASFAFNSYYQKNLKAPGACDFGGTAMVIYSDPSYPGCFYAYRAGQIGATVNATARISPRPFSASLIVVLALWYVDFGGDGAEVKRRALDIGEAC